MAITSDLGHVVLRPAEFGGETNDLVDGGGGIRARLHRLQSDVLALNHGPLRLDEPPAATHHITSHHAMHARELVDALLRVRGHVRDGRGRRHIRARPPSHAVRHCHG